MTEPQNTLCGCGNVARYFDEKHRASCSNGPRCLNYGEMRAALIEANKRIIATNVVKGDNELGCMSVKREPLVFEPHWPDGINAGKAYRIACDDNGRNGGSWAQVLVDAQGDVYLSVQDWEEMPAGASSLNPCIRNRTLAGGGRNTRTRQALLWLAEAIRLDNEENLRGK